MTQLSYIEELEMLFLREDIIKIFHDGNEDCSYLINSGLTKSINSLFDTQIAYRISKEYENLYKYSKKPNASISLKELLEKMLNVVKDEKDEIRLQMKKDKKFWAERPLSSKMLKYAAEDVLLLFKVYTKFISTMSNELIIKVMKESIVNIRYSSLNLDVSENNRYSLKQNREISGMLK